MCQIYYDTYIAMNKCCGFNEDKLIDRNEILHISQQLYCRDVCKISFRSVEYIWNQNTTNFGLIRLKYR